MVHIRYVGDDDETWMTNTFNLLNVLFESAPREYHRERGDERGDERGEDDAAAAAGSAGVGASAGTASAEPAAAAAGEPPRLSHRS